MGEDLPVARVICRLNAADARKEMQIMLADMFDQLGLGLARPGDENFARICNGHRDVMQKAPILATFRWL